MFTVLTIATCYVPSMGPPVNCATYACITASGAMPGPTIAACGPGWQLGDTLWVPGYGKVRCGDRFGVPPDRYAVDLYFPNLAEARRWGHRKKWPVTLLVPRGLVE